MSGTKQNKSVKYKIWHTKYNIRHNIQNLKDSLKCKNFFSVKCRANLNFPGKSKKKRGSVMDFFSPFGDTKPFGGFGSHMSGAA